MTLQASKEPKNRQLLMILSAIALIFFCILSTQNFLIPIGKTKLRFVFPGVIPTLKLLVDIALRALLVFYFVALYKQEKTKMILTVIFGGFTVIGILNLFTIFVNMIRFDALNFMTILSCLLNIATYALFTLLVCTDGKTKILALLPAILLLGFNGLGFLGNLITVFQYLDRGLAYYALTNFASGVSALSYALFLLVFAVSYGPSAATTPAAKAPAALTGPEKLQLLFQEYQKGNLTEEEFQAKRQEILENC